jgi:hypothetical protein
MPTNKTAAAKWQSMRCKFVELAPITTPVEAFSAPAFPHARDCMHVQHYRASQLSSSNVAMCKRITHNPRNVQITPSTT